MRRLSLRRSRRIMTTPRMMMTRRAIGEMTEIAMTAALIKID